MSTTKRILLAVGALALAHCPAGRAAEPIVAPRGIGRLLPLESKELPVEFALQAIDEDGFSFYASQEKELQFEMFLQSPVLDDQKPGSLRMVAEKREDFYTLTMLDHRAAPLAVYRDRRLFWLAGEEGWRDGAAKEWCFSFDAKSFGECHDPVGLGLAEDRNFSIDLPGAMKTVMGGQAKSANWDALSRTLTIVKANGTIAHLRFRSPDDQAHYGFLWSEAAVRSKRTQWTVVGFTNRRTDFFTTTAGSEDIRDSVRATDPGAEGPPPNLAKVRIESEIQRLLSTRMEAALASPTHHREVHRTHRALLRTTIGVSQDKEKMNELSNPKIAVAIMGRWNAGLLRESADQLAAELPHFPDDPVLIRREAEGRLGASLLDLQVRGLVLQLLGSDILVGSVRDDLCDALGDLGKPIGVEIDLPLEPVRADPFLDAILRAHWLEPCGKEQIDACLKALKKAEPSGNTEYVAAETLLRMDAWDEIPSAVAERWWKKFVTDAAAPERTRSLTLVTQHARGRDRLAGQLKAGSLPKEVARDAAKALLRRVTAVEKTRRWESIAEETCRAWRKDFTSLAE